MERMNIVYVSMSSIYNRPLCPLLLYPTALRAAPNRKVGGGRSRAGKGRRALRLARQPTTDPIMQGWGHWRASDNSLCTRIRRISPTATPPNHYLFTIPSVNERTAEETARLRV